jgi:hypothetical protein
MLLALLVPAAVLLAAASPAGEPLARGRGAAGVVEVGRPLDVVRTRAERRARERAAADLVAELAGEGAGDAAVEEIRRRAEGREASWQVRYWSNGAVTATVTIPAGGLDGGGPPSGGER